MTATLTTYGGEHYENLGIRLSDEGELLTDKEVPDYILDELLVALQSYQSQEIMLNMQAAPRSQAAPTTMKRRQARSQWPGTYQPFNSDKNDF
jgi:recombinational DNA repair ATPase RecF